MTSRRRGSDHDTTTLRGSDPVPRNLRGGTVPTGTVPRPQGAKTCAKCGDTKPTREFPLLDDLEAVGKRWATRLWCGPCLVAGRHITPAQLRDHYAAHPVPRPIPADRRARVESKAREHAYFNDLIDQAATAEDPAAFLRALARAHENARLAVGKRSRPAAIPAPPLADSA